jgi:hypothetical protein
MKAILALALLAVLALTGARCGSSKRNAVTLGVAAPTNTTLPTAKTGDTVRCGSFGAQVPPVGQDVTANADGPSSSGTLKLTWKSGSLHVSCEHAGRQAARRTQTPLTGPTFWNRVKRLVGLTSS